MAVVNGDRTDTSHPMRSMWTPPRVIQSGREGLYVEVEVSTMKRQLFLAAIVSLAGAFTLGAQEPRGQRGPGPMPGPGGMGARGSGAVDDPAQFLLGRTGELGLTDAQVTRLAAIARRSAERRRATRMQMDSLQSQRTAGAGRPDSAGRARMRQQFEQMRPAMERLRAQAQTDRRDAIAVLTPDQQARAWERIAASGRTRGGMGRGFSDGRGMHGGRMGMRRRGSMGPRYNADRQRPQTQRRPEDQ